MMKGEDAYGAKRPLSPEALSVFEPVEVPH